MDKEELLQERETYWGKGFECAKEKYKKQLTKAKDIINDLVHLGEFNEHTDEEYFNYQVHEALKNAEQFLKEVEE